MKAFQRFAKFFGIVTVKEIGNQVRVTGVDASILRHHFKILFETDGITKAMFTTITDTSFTLNRFFVPDLVYMLAKLRESPQATWSGKRTIDKIVDGILKNTWFKCSIADVEPITDMSRVNVMKWKPMPKQIEFLDLFGDKIPRYDLQGYILGFAAGGGKTFADLLIAECIVPPSVAEVKIIISPKKALHLVWEKTINAVFKKVPSYWCCDSYEPMPLQGCEYYIFNFERIGQAIELGKHLLSKNVRYFVLVDESHNFADYKSTRTKQLVTLQTLREDIYFLWTSGTPVLKSAAELTSFLKCSDKRFDADAEKRFRRIYSSAPGRANEIFNHRLGRMMAFTVGAESFGNPKPIVKELPIKLPPALAHRFLMSTVREDMRIFIEQRLDFYKGHIKEYRKTVEYWMRYHEDHLGSRQAKKAFWEYQKNLKITMRALDRLMPEIASAMKDYERSKLLPSLPPLERQKFRNALSALKNIKLKVRGEALGTVLAKRRAECTTALALYCKPEKIMNESLSKTLFFSSAVAPVKTLNNKLVKMGYEPVLVYADTNADLTKNIDRFTEDPNVNPVCATFKSLSEAVPVIAASTVVFLDRPYRQSHWDQIQARANRIGQKHQVTVIEVTLFTGDELNVSTRTDQILANVRELMNQIVGEEFAGPPLEDRVYLEAIDSSKENPDVSSLDEQIGL